MQELLLWTQIISIVTFLGTCFYLYHVLVKVYEARINGMQEEIDRLKSRLESPSDYQTKLDLNETLNQKKIALLEGEKQKAIEDGNMALAKEKSGNLEKLLDWAMSYTKLQRELDEYKKADQARENHKSSFQHILRTLRFSDGMNVIPLPNYPQLADVLGKTPKPKE